MSRFWSSVVHNLSPYVPGEQPKLDGVIKLNTNENPYPPSPRVLAAIIPAADHLRLYPDPRASSLCETIAARYDVAPEEVFVGNGSDEVLAHTFQALLNHDEPLLFPDITYSFYPVYCRLYGVRYEEVPLDAAMRVQIADYRRPSSAILLANPNAPTALGFRARRSRRWWPNIRISWSLSTRLTLTSAPRAPFHSSRATTICSSSRPFPSRGPWLDCALASPLANAL